MKQSANDSVADRTESKDANEDGLMIVMEKKEKGGHSWEIHPFMLLAIKDMRHNKQGH